METFDSYQLNELLKTQKEFDDRIEDKNIEDTATAFIIEFTEWVNTVEFFKNWKKKPGKEKPLQLDELADLLAFSLSKMHQSEHDIDFVIHSVIKTINTYQSDDEENNIRFDSTLFLMMTHMITGTFLDELTDAQGEETFVHRLNIIYSLPFLIALEYYTIEELLEAYKNKMEVNHDRQDGKADKEKGYI